MELLGGIRHVEHAIQTPAWDPAWRPRVSRAVAQLRAAFAEHVDLTEGPGGLYAGVLGDAPRLARRFSGLVDDHETVRSALDELSGRLDHGEANALRWEAAQLIQAVWDHRQRGADLLYEAYETDLGGET
ncbi:hemerythrin domain-containing protein [Dactylosporangium sp. NPDC005572]|uniref:hemerythrin domain-containing protein n=1 Tax=Dactylosporangium sp. NPDC005572 TaxID=3156889 RepID=UPI0033AC6FDF